MRIRFVQPAPTTPRITVKLTGPTYDVLAHHLRADAQREQFAFLLALPVAAAQGPVLLVQHVVLPESGDLVEHTAGGVEPHPNYQALVYLIAAQRGLVVLDAHTHLTDASVCLSAVDRKMAKANARYIARRLPPPALMGLLVFNRPLSAFDGILFDRDGAASTPILELQTIGPGLAIRSALPRTHASPADDRYARQRLVPGWNQDVLARLRIGIAGMGGHGAQLVQSLASIGAGAAGWIALVDPDTIETSNLPRIPFATPDDVGKPKVRAAADFVRRKNPGATVHAYPCSVAAPAALAALRGADVLFGCGDNDGVRLVMNDMAVRCGTPLIDLGADIHVGMDKVEAGGQVRVIVPGSTGCLACCGAFDPEQAAVDLLSPHDRAVYTGRGYLIGVDDGPTPSVTVLNALMAQHAVSALLALIGSGPFVRHDYMHVDWLTSRTLVARVPRRDDCPTCGARGFMMAGPPADTNAPTAEPAWMPVTDPETSTEDLVPATRSRRRRPRCVRSSTEP